MTTPVRPALPFFDVQKLIRLLIESWLWVAGAVGLAVIVALIVILRTPASYIATALVRVQDYEQNVVDIPDIQRDDLASVESVLTIESTLASRPVLEAILERKEYGVTPARLGIASGDRPSKNSMIRALAERVRVGLVRGTRLISVAVEDHDPEFAATAANAIVTEFLRLEFEQRLGVSSSATGFLNVEAERLRQEVADSEARLQGYLDRTQAVSVDDTQNIIVEQLKELNAKVIEAKTERLQLEAAAAQIRSASLSEAEQLLSIPYVANAPSVQTQTRAVAEMEAEVANLNERYLEKHPKLMQAKSQLVEQRDELRRTILKTAQSVDAQYEAALDTEKKFSQALAEQESRAIKLNGISVEYKSLAREVEANRDLYEAVQKRRKETGITAGLRKDLVQLIEPATPPDHPVKPRKKLILAAALVLGTLFGVGFVLVRHFLDTTFHTIDEAESSLGLRALAAIPQEPATGGKTLVLATAPAGHAAEALRTLRTSLVLAGDAQTILFVSALQGEGKTFCSLNYAAAAADSGERTLLIDGDLRLPSIGEELFGADGRAKAGLSDVLAGKTAFADAVVRGHLPGLDVLCAGVSLTKPAELLAGKELAEFLMLVSTQYERIVIDAAPLAAVSDGLLLARCCEVVCLVVRAASTPRKIVRRVIGDLHQAGTPPSGFVLNGVPVDAKGYYYHYSSGSYGSGVYGAAGAAK